MRGRRCLCSWARAEVVPFTLQLHILDGHEDFEIAQRLAATVPEAELFVYPGTEHYLAEHDDEAAALLMQRVLGLLDSDSIHTEWG